MNDMCVIDLATAVYRLCVLARDHICFRQLFDYCVFCSSLHGFFRFCFCFFFLPDRYLLYTSRYITQHEAATCLVSLHFFFVFLLFVSQLITEYIFIYMYSLNSHHSCVVFVSIDLYKWPLFAQSCIAHTHTNVVSLITC